MKTEDKLPSPRAVQAGDIIHVGVRGRLIFSAKSGPRQRKKQGLTAIGLALN